MNGDGGVDRDFVSASPLGAVAPSRRTLFSIAALATLTFALALLVTSWVSFIDLRVYREGGDAMLRGLNLYSGDFPYSDTKFRTTVSLNSRSRFRM